MKKRKSKILIPIIAVLFSAIIIYVVSADTAIGITEITVSDKDLPKAFDGFRIVQISDLHNAEFGDDNIKLTRRLTELAPDMIVLTGDLYDSRFGSFDVPLDLAKSAAGIAPTYFVSGNHDADAEDFDNFRSELERVGVTVLSNNSTVFEEDGESISIIGISDPWEYRSVEGSSREHTVRALDEAMTDTEGFRLLLAHRPEHIDTYSSYGPDLVFCGHAHGGQFRLPIIGGLYAPNQGIFPKYDAGLYTVNDTNMIVSRGLGNSSFPFRLFNNPEIVVAELVCTED